jgi:gliding motility-associated-like protein
MLWGNQHANAQIALQYSDTTTCPGQPVTMCAALTGHADPLFADDSYTGVVDIGFPFLYFGKPYTRCLVSGNGMISFDTTDAGQFAGWMWSQVSVGSPPQCNNSIFVTFFDMNLFNGGKIRYQHFGPVGHRRFIVEWCQIPTYNCTDLINTTQCILYEGTNVIEMHTTHLPMIVGNCPGASGFPNQYHQVIQGVMNDNGSVAYYPLNRDPIVSTSNWGNFGAENDAMRFTPNGTSTYMMDSIPFNPWIIIDSVSSSDLQWYAEGQPNLPIATGPCNSVVANRNINYYTVKFDGNAGCKMDSVFFIDTVHVHFGTKYDTTYAEVCAGSTYSWLGRNLYAAGNYDTLFSTPFGCDSFVRLRLSVNPLPDMTIKGSPNVQICDESSTTLFLLTPQTGVTYQWSKDGYPISGETGSSLVVSQGGQYTATGTTGKGCQATSQAFTLKVNPIPVAQILPLSNKDVMCAYDTLEITANAGTAYDYRWTPEKPFRIVTGAEGRKVKGVFIDPTTPVVLTVFNQFGCYDSDTITVQTRPCCWVSVPNAFTPNSDGSNDYFGPLLQPGQILVSFTIFDRLGKQIYNNENIRQGWNGKYKNGEDAPNGVYMYYLKYTCADGKLYDRKESVTLLR